MATALHSEDAIQESLSDPGIIRAAMNAFQVPVKQPLSEWAEQYRMLPDQEAKPGPYRIEHTPWCAEIMDRLTPQDPCIEVVLMKSTQVGATEMGNNWVAQMIVQYPNRFLCVQPTIEMARRHMRSRINPMISSTPAVTGRTFPTYSKHGTNTVLEKEFTGGRYILTGSNSGPGLRSIACPYIHFDELEAYVADVAGEGDPISIAKRRADTFGWKRKFFYTSTPLDEDTSKIEPLYNSSDRNRYYVPCPHCGTPQLLIWAQVRWDEGKPESAQYVCNSCNTFWSNAERIQATKKGYWIADREWQRHMPRGYHINAIYSHTVDLGELAQEWLEAQRNVEKLITFVNTRLGETWKDQSIYSYEPDALLDRREVYQHQAPEGVQLITGGVDVQDDRLEAEVMGWGFEEEAWSLGHHVFYGDTAKWEVWQQLTELLSKPYDSPEGPLYISACAVDSGHQTNMVYNYCVSKDDHRTHRVWPIKGGADLHRPIWWKKPIRNNLKKISPYMVNTYQAKVTLFQRLRNIPGGPGSIHFSTEEWHNQDYFEQLTSESLRTKKIAGRFKKDWVVKRGRRNEVLDTVVYAFAAMKGMMKSGFKFSRPKAEPPDGRGKGDGLPQAVSTPAPEPAKASAPTEVPVPASRPAPSVNNRRPRRRFQFRRT